ncbi:MAG: hypothetical protein Q9159_000848 [Coniocarpon cinnabarinum]
MAGLARYEAPHGVGEPFATCLRPTPFVPDVSTFLKLIGRNLSQHASKIESWDTLFRLTSPQLRDLGVEPARTRKYLLRWREKFRHGEFGIGGDAKFIGRDGAVECRLVEVPLPEEQAVMRTASLASSPGSVKRVLNVPWTDPMAQEEQSEDSSKQEKVDQSASDSPNEGMEAQSSSTDAAPRPSQRPVPLDDQAVRRARPIEGVKHKPGRGLYGPYLQIAKGSHGEVGVLEVKEGMWEHRRGQKVDGGERRKAEVRFKRASAERRAARK